MEFYVLLKSILYPFSHWKWVWLVLTVEGSSKQSDFFTKVWWPLIHVNIKESSYQTYNYFTSYPLSYPCQHWIFLYITLLYLFYFYNTTPPPLLLPSHQLLFCLLLWFSPLPSLKFAIVIRHRCCDGKWGGGWIGHCCWIFPSSIILRILIPPPAP